MRIIQYIVLSLCLLWCSSCSDLEEQPVGLLTIESIQSEDDVEILLTGAYGLLASESIYGRRMSMALMIRGDMTSFTAGTARRVEVDDFNISPDNGMISSFWPQSYSVITTANAAIEATGRLGLDETDENRLIAEARFIRGFMYFHLVRIFGDIPYIGEFVTDPDEVASIDLTNENEVYAHVLEDLAFAADHLPSDWGTRIRPSAGTALSYLALAHLTLGNFEEAAQASQQVIQNRGDYGYQLAPNFVDLFDYEATTDEPVFAIGWLANIDGPGGTGDDLIGIHTRPSVLPGGGFENVGATPRQEDSFPDDDPRKRITVTDTLYIGEDGNWVLNIEDTVSTIPRNQEARRESPVILKYHYKNAGAVNANSRNSELDYNAMRYAEVLLIAAEALIERPNPDLNTAASYIDEVRSRAGIPSLAMAGVNIGDQTEMRAAIREERRLELAYEFKRWYDIKRWDIITEAFGPAGLEPKTPVPGPERYYFPRPQIDIDINPNLAN